MNRCISFDVVGNVVKRRDGFNPVRGERNYTKLRFYFKPGYGWDNCEILTCSFFVSADQMIKSEPAIYESNTGCAEFAIPAEYQSFSGRMFVGVQGTYDENGKAVTISSNVTCIDVSKGLLVSEGASQELYEKVMLLIKQISGGNVSSVLNYGAVGDGETDDSVAVRNAVKNSNILIFPPGRYKITGAEFEGLSDKTLIFKDAGLIYEGENDGSVLKFSDCDNISISGGAFDGSNTAKFGLNFVDSKNVNLNGVSVQNVGNSDTVGASGINFVGDCSNSKVIDASVDGVTSGIPDASGYIFAHGIGFIRSSTSGRYSQNVEIIHPVIRNVGYVDGKNYVDAVIEGEEVTHYEVGGVTCKPDIMDGSHARIDGDGIFIVQSTGAGGEHDGAESFFSIKNVDIQACSKRALKIAARCVDVDGGRIYVATWSAAVEVQRVRHNSLRNLNITDTTYTPVTINGGDGPMVIENCRITGGGMNSNGSGGVVLGAKSTGLVEGSEIVHIENCVFDNVRFPVYAAIDSNTAGKTDSEELVIKDCLIKHFYGDAAVKLEEGDHQRYQRLGKLTIENVSFAYGISTATVFFANNNLYNQSISLNSRLFNFFSPEKTVKVICDDLSDDFREIFESYNLTTPNQIFEMPLQPDVLQAKLTSGNYSSNHLTKPDRENKFKASVTGNTVLLSDTSNKTYIQGDRVVVPLESPVTVSKGERLILTIYNSHPQTDSVNDLTVNFYTDLNATEGSLAGHDENYPSGFYTAYVKKKTYELSLDQSLELKTMVIRVNANNRTITEGTAITVSLKTEKKLKDFYTKAEVDALIEDLYTKAEVDALIEDLYTKAEVDALIEDLYTKAEVDALIEDLRNELINSQEG